MRAYSVSQDLEGLKSAHKASRTLKRPYKALRKNIPVEGSEIPTPLKVGGRPSYHLTKGTFPKPLKPYDIAYKALKEP